MRRKTVDHSGNSDLFIPHSDAACFGDYSGFSASVSAILHSSVYILPLKFRAKLFEFVPHPQLAICEIVRFCSNLLGFVTKRCLSSQPIVLVKTPVSCKKCRL